MFDLKTLTAPILLAPMAGGFNTPALAAAVANAGGVGSFGFAYTSAEDITQTLDATARLTSGALNANFFVFPKVSPPSAERVDDAIAALGALPLAADALRTDPPSAPYSPDLAAQLEPIWQHRPSLLTFHFGLPEPRILDKAKGLGISVGVTATCLAEAQAIAAAGADFVVAQGWEAGGHRGQFASTEIDTQRSVLALVSSLTQTLGIPVVAAGGLMNGTDIANALTAGATAVQLGTAFLICDEAGTSVAHRLFLQQEKQRETVYTTAFSGRPARGLRNVFIDAMSDQPTLAFPLQNTLTGALRRWASQVGDMEYQSVWAGAKVSAIRSMPAAMLVQTLLSELSLEPREADSP